MRLTRITRSHASASTSVMSPQASVPAAVTIASSPPAWRAARCTASSAARAFARSTCSNAKPFCGGWRSSTSAVPPPCSTASAIAAPSPDEPPVTSTVPSGRSTGTGEYLRDQPGRRATGDIGNDDGAPAPLGERLRLGQLGDGVVAALGPDVRLQRGEDGARVVLLEDRDGVHAGQAREHGRAVLLRDQRPVVALQARDRRV